MFTFHCLENNSRIQAEISFIQLDFLTKKSFSLLKLDH